MSYEPTRKSLILLVAVGIFLICPVASAHQTGASNFVAHVKAEENQIDTLLAFPGRDVADEMGLDFDESGDISSTEISVQFPKLVERVSSKIEVSNDGRPCEVIEEKTSDPRQSVEAFWILKAYRCDAPLSDVRIVNRVMLESPQSYRHFGKIQLGEEVYTTIFGAEGDTYEIRVGGPPPPVFEVVKRYLLDGVKHIVFGPDHVLFVLLLVLITTRFKRLVLVITSFTLAHSLTLAAAALEWVSISAGIIEPIIAISIAYMAIETAFREEQPRYLALVTFAFGLIHGFGFSYVLRDDVGLPTEALIPALASFNIGVELGQLAIVALVFPLRLWMHEKPWERTVMRVICALTFALAMWWVIERTILA